MTATNDDLLRQIHKLQYWVGVLAGLFSMRLVVSLLTLAFSGYVFLIVHEVVADLQKLGVA